MWVVCVLEVVVLTAVLQLYICYPKGGLGMKGIEAIMAMLQKPK